ncbi:predicted protein [Aspergillus nidulans FGSC A4]|uniref:SnoaL-like domain-containing protein n=1 Tax=Emericella nidulans (strain FGSC A4 / ATCC 38163 / CBS 112.46 / NRRL 194 / M139) TaxID=227321 RepID=Q5BA65_EMENI|nr:hypothetical protein [Aspergillus nidulans FGSC A4]EAA64670.1 predicted protein [Aspergillus nidulans FGSC A4]CBF87109.1 TPA: conserved hypothetical protein [Aspergillus nidulans FGSC A4]|eukprot:XP_660169.1 predicted protein [Aspergillus nidulans FGSC A4]
MSSVNLGQMGDGSGAQVATMQFIQQFYTLLDGESPEAAQEWSDMFADDAEFVTPVQTLGGRQAIRAQREEFWTQFPGLKHQPVRVYVSPFSPLDVVVINSYEFTGKDGQHVLSHTAAEFRLVESKDNRLVVQRLEIFLDPTVLGWK